MKTKFFFISVIAWHFMACAALSGGPCEPTEDIIVLREDAKNKRLFVKANDETIKDIDTLTALLSSIGKYIEQCKPEWERKWSVSLFTEKKYASYKDDESVRSYVIDGSWERSYLAEYSNRKQLLTRYPLDPNKRLVDQIDLLP